ncbi:MAG: phage head protein [Sphingomonadaceae bacterium]|nr:phage head protein [Sphingomonadaceae bacterium]
MSDDHPSAVSGAFREPFPEQIAFFRGKLGTLVPTERWDDMLGAAHDDAFMVAGATKADLLTDLAAATDKAIAEGTGLEAFRKDFRSIVKKHGWTGWTGEGSIRGEAWRVKTIYSTNSYTSYAAGRMAQLKSGNYPFWLYFHGGSLEPRPQHLSWDGMALPPDHDFWTTHYPPSDWGCSCYVIGARSARGIKRLGGDPDKKLPKNWKRIDPRTGAPVGIGKGWNYAPGASVSDTVRAMAGKIGKWDYQIAKAYMDELPAGRADALADAYRALPSTADDVRRYAQRVYEPKPDLPELAPQRTFGLVRSDQAARIKELTGKSAAGYDFSFDTSAVGHVIRQHGDDAIERQRGQRGVVSGDFALLPRILSSPDGMSVPGTSSMAEQLVEFAKRIGNETYVVRLAVRGTKRRTLALKTLFIKTGKK